MQQHLSGVGVAHWAVAAARRRADLGLDPALDRRVMPMLRQLADAGRVVLVITYSLSYLDVCDHVLLLAT